MWHFRGSPPYLQRQADRMGFAPMLAHTARHNAEMHRVATLMGQLSERLHRTRRDNGRPLIGRLEAAQIMGTLDQAENEVRKLHMLAAAGAQMIDEAYRAFDLVPPARTMSIHATSDRPITLPLGDGTVGAIDADIETARAHAESG
jgi:hypothetical protein